MRLLARRGIDDPQELYLCGDGGSPGRLHSLEGVFLGDGVTGEEESLFDCRRDFLRDVGVSFALKTSFKHEDPFRGFCKSAHQSQKKLSL